MKSRWTNAWAVAAVAVALATSVGGQASSGSDDLAPAHSVGAREAKAAIAYWTPERMEKAIPHDMDPAGRTMRDRIRRVESGEPAELPAASGRVGSDSSSPESMAGTNVTKVPRPYTDLPDRLNGRVFFTKYLFGVPFGGTCSGTSVNSSGKSLVWTAGHCIHGGSGFGYHSDWIFVPAYRSDPAVCCPYGKWPAKQLQTLKGWSHDSDNSYDFGAVIVWRNSDGTRLTNLIGGHGILFNQNRTQLVYIFGYPSQSPYDGKSQYRCVTFSSEDDDIGDGPEAMGALCGMTKGSSGGGWIINMSSNNIGSVHSVNSYQYPDEEDDVMYGPYQGSAALGLYNANKYLSG
jgi:hypothetical protein